MDNQKISNPKVEVPKTKEMNDKDYMNDLLETEKNMSTNMNIALNESSNQTLYDEIYEMFKSIRELQRKLYEKSFSLGWYTLEKAEENKITEKNQQLVQELEEL